MNAPLIRWAIGCANWQELPLAGNGRCLVEASAGTGKTWTIAVLYLRLLLECGHGPREIVVTTFSIAAAQELRERIRARLLEAAALVADFDPLLPARNDEGTLWLHARWSGMDTVARMGERNRLALALAELDLAPIGTLHGLCRRILAEHPFDSGSAFAPGEQIDSADLDRELHEDLWRRLAQSDAQKLDDGDRVWFDTGKDRLEAALRRVCKIGVNVLEIESGDVDDIMRPERAVEIGHWIARHAADRLKSSSVWHRGLSQLAAYIEAGNPCAPWLDKMDSLDQKLATPFLKAHVEWAAADPVIHFVQHAVGVLKRVPIRAKAAALARYRMDMLAAREQRLHERGQLTYDALIEWVLAALGSPAGTSLATRLRETWPVALVDEFQDTDAQQYAILDRIYGDGTGCPLGRLVMIGDPKQAIYGFRGGDVQAYLDASASATHRLPITVNFRSSRELVGAVNDLFAFAGPALSQSVSAQIAYAPVSASGRPDEEPFTCNGVVVARPLQFHLTRAEKGGRRDDALRACANQIAGMLDARCYRIGKDVLQPGDIAVLLPRHRDVSRLRNLLAERGVPCVGAGKQSVFTTEVASDLQIVLHGIEHASEEALVRAAMATRLFGIGVDGVRALLGDAWQRQQQRFVRWRNHWRSDGVLAVVQSVTAANAAQLAIDPHAERTLTDLRHLAELLQEQSETCDGPASLLAWFAEQRSEDGEGEAADVRQLRIESDSWRVQLMTVHASKGLQFPIVFLPLPDADAIRRTDLPLVRDNHGGRVLDLGSEGFDDAVKSAMFDEQDEGFRKLYVAMTRAQFACYIYASARKIDGSDPERAALSALLARLRHRLQGRSVAEASAHIAWSEHDTWPAEAFEHFRDSRSNPEVERRAIALPPARPHEGRYSFSSLTPHADAMFEERSASDEEAVARGAAAGSSSDAEPGTGEPDHAELAALSAHEGASFGTAIHTIFELHDPRKPMREQQPLVRSCLADMGFDLPPALIVAVATRVQASLDAQLLERAPLLCLSAIPPASMRAEMRFHYTLDEVSIPALREACARHGEPDLVPEHAPRVLRGLMTGAIDLIFEYDGRFHVLDYKSNYLGDRLSAYTPTSLRTEMDHHHYRLQALLYTIAVDRYLRQRLPGYQRDRQLGEAIYLFVRAAGLAPGAGVWTHRFADALIADADAVLSGAKAVVAR